MEGFELILDPGETILKTYKPNKKRFTIVSLIGGLPSLIVPVVFVLLAVLMLTGVIDMRDENGVVNYTGAIFFLVFSSIFMLAILSAPFTSIFRYKKQLYCVTNKRIIIRHGFIGVDFKSLDLKAIGAVNVQVDFLDKLIKPNTGKITFGSNAAPITTGNQKGQNIPFEFACVDNPYEVYREVKSFIDMNVNQ